MKVTQLCPTLCNPMDYTVHGILWARILEWVAFLNHSSWPGILSDYWPARKNGADFSLFALLSHYVPLWAGPWTERRKEHVIDHLQMIVTLTF